MTEWRGVGRVRKLLEVMRADPERVFTTHEAARIMDCRQEYVYQAVKYALTNGAMFCKSFGRGVPMLLRGSEFTADFVAPAPRKMTLPSQKWKEGKEAKPDRGWATDPDDPRIGKVVPDWKPPVMRFVRGGA